MIDIGKSIGIELVKKHLNIDSSFVGDDKYIQLLVEAAVSAVCNHCDVNSLSDFVGTIDDTTSIPQPILIAILMMVANLYANREPVSFASCNLIPLSYQYLLEPYINYSGKL